MPSAMLFDLTFPRLTLEKKETAISPTQKLTKARGLAPGVPCFNY